LDCGKKLEHPEETHADSKRERLFPLVGGV